MQFVRLTLYRKFSELVPILSMPVGIWVLTCSYPLLTLLATNQTAH
jgi:hypothetical protein